MKSDLRVLIDVNGDVLNDADTKSRKSPTNLKRCISLVSVAVVSVVLGFLFGRLTPSVSVVTEYVTDSLAHENDISLGLLNEIKAENIRANLRFLTNRTHVAGTAADFETADHLAKYWESVGLSSNIVSYDVLLSYPSVDNKQRNSVRQYNENGVLLHESTSIEEVLLAEDNKPGTLPHFNAYSPAGKVKGQPIYVNYARKEDFDFLRANYPTIDIKGKICIARYGAIFRGDKAKFAQQYGCAGLLLHFDANPVGTKSFYPNTEWLPPTGAQRGTLKTPGAAFGDPLTPGYAATASAFRQDVSEAPEVPTIPVQPICTRDAAVLLANMSGPEPPAEWHGTLPIVYHIGPGYANDKWMVEIELFNTYERRKIYNAFGIIPGHVEPDRYVLMGNHRDAWVVGSVDPTSGTAVMMEVSRAMGAMLQKGWKPRRTIIFCSWGAEEYGLIGSTEWTEEYRRILEGRTVAYFNVDTAVSGNVTLYGGGVPSLYGFLYNATRKVANPNAAEVAAGLASVYDSWKFHYPELDEHGQPTGRPRMNNLGAGSDHAPMLDKLGVPCLNIEYGNASTAYPLYHSAYDSFHASELMDPTFAFHRASGQVTAEVLRNMADSHVLPFDMVEYHHALARHAGELDKQYGDAIRSHLGQPVIDYFLNAITAFGAASEAFMERLCKVDKKRVLAVRAINDQIMHLERMFIDPFGLPDRKDIRHVVYAPSMLDSYSDVVFPGVVDTLQKAAESGSASDWSAVARQMAAATSAIEAAGASLRDVIAFMKVSSGEVDDGGHY